jgi:hypothetical protein
MAETEVRSGEPTGQSGHQYVTGSATLQPGTFHEPDQPSQRFSDSLTGKAEEMASAAGTAVQDAWTATISCMSRHPVAVFVTGIGLGFLLARTVRF